MLCGFSICYAEEPKLPEFFEEIKSPIALSNNSVFYNQLMEKRTLENFENRFIIVNFWASWSMDCNNELIALNDLQKTFRKKPLLVITLSQDFKEVDFIDNYFNKHKIDYLDIYLDRKGKIYQSLDINHLPASYLVDFDGRIIARSIPGILVDWSDENFRAFLESKLSKHQLLPPEFKKTREKYEAPTQSVKKEIVKPQSNKPKILIN